MFYSNWSTNLLQFHLVFFFVEIDDSRVYMDK